ncbi:MAG: hypothetical protein DRI77_03425 [Chloroflexi bacterium]|nr:MAG: hypothetical protein DRI77_03425 [Chloroflexota bacterium]
MSTSALRIRIFGSLELTKEGKHLFTPSSPTARSLLAYLVLRHDQPIPRDRLTGIFWPERTDARARRALSQALWQIRSALGSAADRLAAERDAVTFVFRPGDWLDVEEFESKTQEAGSKEQGTGGRRWTGDSCLLLLDSCIQLYRADFLQECYDDWALLERERLRELYLSALEQLITLSKQQGNYKQALAYAQRLAAADPLREAAHRELMRLYHLLDRPQAALEQFAALRDLLARELDIPPTPATLALYREIAAALEEAGPSHLPVALPPPPLLRDLAHLPFVGRTSERAALLDGLQTTIQGRGGLALIEGDAGVGKTRLVSEVIADAQWRGFQVGLGKADPLTASAPYQLLHNALSPLLTPLRVAQLAELVDPLWLSAAAPLLPPIAAHARHLAVLAPLDSREEQRRLQEGLAQCLIGLASATPLLLVLEDLHWADKVTLATLSQLAAYLPESRVFLILTYRTAEAREMAAVWETLGSLDRAHPLARLRLLPFERAETVALVQRALSVMDTQTVALAERLQKETGGNPLFLIETLKSLWEQGDLATSPHGGWLFPPRDRSLLMPASVRELIGERVARLALAPRTALEQIAVLGEDADFAILSQISTAETVSLLAALEDLTRYGFLVETETHYRFEHDCIQEMTYQAIPPERRRVLHRRAGAFLRQQHPERIESLARHFSLGEVWDKAADYSRRAGDRARAVYAGGEAVGYYTQALEAWEHLRSPDEELGPALYQARGKVCQETGRFDQAEADFEAARGLAEQAGDEASQARALNRLSYLRFQRGDFEDAIAVAERALGLAIAIGLQSEIAAALFNKANAIRNLGHYREAIEPYEQAAAIFERLDEQARLADCLNRMGAARYHTGDYAGSQMAIERSLAIRRRLDDRVGISYSLVNLASLCYYRGQFTITRDASQEALEIASAIGDPYGEDAALHCLGLAILERGDPAQAIPLFQRALEVARKIGDRPLEPESLAGLGTAYQQLGDLGQAQEMLEQSLNLSSISAEQWQVQTIHGRLARLFLATNRGQEALAHARVGLQVAQELGDPWVLGVARQVMGKVSAHLGSAEAVAEPGSHFEESIHILREVGAEAELARSLAAYGLYLRRSAGKTQRSAALLGEARALFQQLGMARDLSQLAADESAACSRPGQIQVRLPAASAPTGRPLREDEFVEVVWTIAAPEDDEIAGKAARRRHCILRLLREAAARSAAPPVAALADALGVSARTIKRDLAALRTAGHDARTRGSR